MQLHNRVVPADSSPAKDGSENGKVDSKYEIVMRDLHYDAKWQEEVNLGLRVGLYRFRGELGSGNFSRVKMAVHQLTKENVAIKMVDKGKLDEKTRRMLQQEISAMERVHHPNIIRLYEVLETYSKVFLAMEYARGGELYNKITTTGRIDEGFARVVFAQICSAVQHMHERLIIHRDIKAENVFFSSASRVKLGDFGFSAQLTTGPDEPLNMFCGSPPYAAPELFRDDSYVGGPVDVWALGVLLYFLVVGRMPFRGQNVPTIKSHILAGTFTIPRYLSREVTELIEKALKQVPSERPTVTEILASDWLVGVPSTPQLDCNQSFILQPTVLPYKAPTEPHEPAKYSEVEKAARERLEAIGISGALLAAHAAQGSRSHVIGCYRIIVHRIERQLSVFTDSDKALNAVSDAPAATGLAPAFCDDTGCWGKRKSRSHGSRTCAIL